MPDDIVVVMTDDHGQWCLGLYGDDQVHTPTLDHLAATGVRMDNAFCPTPVCSPSRASFFTGRRPSQHGIHDFIGQNGEYDDADWIADEVTLPEVLADAGYETALFGKWHCGIGHESRVFDTSMNMHSGGWDVPKFSVERDRRIVDHAVSYLRERRDAEEPTFLFVGLTATHSPWEGEPERLVERHRGSEFPNVPAESTTRFGRPRIDYLEDESEALAQYYAAVEGIDEQVGRLVDELAASGRFEETLVCYTADHGHNCGHHGFWGKGNGTYPSNLLEESIRVPLVVGGHDDFFGEQIRSEFVDHCDTFQTLLEFAGVEPQTGRNYPGESYLPQLVDAAESTDREQIQICEYAEAWMARTEGHKLVEHLPDGQRLLFDLEADPRETRNVIDDPEYAEVREELTERLHDERETYVEPGNEGLPTADLPTHSNAHAWEPIDGD
jgi:arylsulfatase A-like enzyme